MKLIEEVQNIIKIIKENKKVKDETNKLIVDKINNIEKEISGNYNMEILLENILDILDYYYYNDIEIIVGDDIYDEIEEKLKKINYKNNHFLKAGTNIKKDENQDFFPEEKHSIIAGSQDKIRFSESSKLNDKLDNFPNADILISDKADGITLVSEYTKNYKKAKEDIKKLYLYQKKYLDNSNMNIKKKSVIFEYINQQYNKIMVEIKKGEQNKNFVLYKILTRGNGIIGNIITFNAINLQNMKYEISGESFNSNDITIRSEAVIKRKDFKKLPYKNPRNGVALLQKQEGLLSEYVSLKPFDLEIHKDNNMTKYDIFKWFEDNDIDTLFYKLVKKENLENEIKNRLSERNESWANYGKDGLEDIFTDGIVVSINDTKIRKNMGMTGMKPNGEFAFKPDPERKYGILKEIEWTVGKNGQITPVIILENPIDISGTTVERISGANKNILATIVPYVGAELEIVKRGEIIPKIEKNMFFNKYINDIEDLIIFIIENNLLSSKLTKKILEEYQKNEISKLSSKVLEKDVNTSIRKLLSLLIDDEKIENKILNNILIKDKITKIEDNNKDLEEKIKEVSLKEIKYPSKCPSCSSELEPDGQILIKCNNIDCKGRKIAQLTHFAKSLTNEVSEGIITKLYEKGLLKDYKDFFNIKSDDLNGLEGWKEKAINNFIEAINNIRISQDYVFMGSLFFKNMGKTAFQNIFQEISFEDLKKELIQLNESDIIEDTMIYKDDLAKEKQNVVASPKLIKEIENSDIEHKEVLVRLLKINGMGPKSLQELINTWINEKDVIEEILNYVTLEASNIVDKSSSKTFCITGSINQLELNNNTLKNRSELTKFLKELGHKVSGSVSKNTTALITDDDVKISPSSKAKKAKSLEVPIITSEEFQNGNYINNEKLKIKQDNNL